MKRISVLAAVVVFAMTTWASATQQLSWVFQDTGFAPGTKHTAVAMRTSQAWPVIFTEGNGSVYGLFATPGPNPNSNWHQIGFNVFGPPQSDPVVAKTGPDGRVVAVQDDVGVVSATTGGWSNLGITAAAFSPAGTLYTANGSNVPTLGDYPGGGTIIDMAVASDGTVGVVDDGGRYFEHTPWLGWSNGMDLMLLGPSINPSSMRLVFDTVGRPHVSALASAGKPANVLSFDFSTQTGQWSYQALGDTDGKAAPIAASLTDDALGMAWLDGNVLKYAYLDDLGAWNVTDVLTGPMTYNQSVGLTFDYAGLPVISFIKESHLWLAYDPVVVPEPATLSLLGLGGLALLKRRAR